jgi:hypothetical protein
MANSRKKKKKKDECLQSTNGKEKKIQGAGPTLD